jgi:streptogrisin B
MVSSGHLFSVGSPLSENGVTIGHCSISRNSGSVDAAFVPINAPASDYPSNVLCNTVDFLSTTTSRPGQTAIVNMRGAASGYKSGAILGTNESCQNPDGTIMTNMTTAAFPAIGGDSGGIIYTYISSSNTRPTVGVLKGRIGDNVAIFSKADLVLTALGVSRY